jgi:hypothetical protein
VADYRDPNRALVKKVTSGIKKSYAVIPILSFKSIQAQWINQEIGYSFGKKKQVIAIIEKGLLENDNLKTK